MHRISRSDADEKSHAHCTRARGFDLQRQLREQAIVFFNQIVTFCNKNYKEKAWEKRVFIDGQEGRGA